MPLKLFLTFLLLTLTSCNNSNQPSPPSSSGTSKSLEKPATNPNTQNPANPKIIFDTVYKDLDYKLTLTRFDTTNKTPSITNTLFTVSKLKNGQYTKIYSDSIYSETWDIRFVDFDNDNVKDILVENSPDVRSNMTYHLYLVNKSENKFRKIKGFEEIKNPHYLPQYNLIDNYVMSGQIWTSFYKIQGDSIKDFGIVIYDNQSDDGSYKRDYMKAIKSILAIEKNNH